MGFAEGFTSGYEMVDGAFARRRQADLEQKRFDEAVRQHAEDVQWRKDRAGIDDNHWNKTFDQTQGNIDADNQFKRDDLSHRIENDAGKLKIDQQQADQQGAYQRAMAGASMLNARSGAAKDQMAIAESRAKLNEYNRSLAKERLFSSMSSPDEQGNVNLMISTDPSMFNQQMNDLTTISGIDAHHAFKYPESVIRHADILNTAVKSPDFFHAHKEDALASFNDLFKPEIEIGVGEKYSGNDSRLQGGTIVGKKISSLVPVSHESGGFSYIPHLEVTVEKDGKRIKYDAPMTENRGHYPNDAIFELTPDHIDKKINAAMHIGDTIAKNQGWVNLARNIARGANDPKEEQIRLANQEKRLEIEKIQRDGVKLGTASEGNGVSISSQSDGLGGSVTTAISKGTGDVSQVHNTVDGKQERSQFNVYGRRSAQSPSQQQRQPMTAQQAYDSAVASGDKGRAERIKQAAIKNGDWN